jgi:demethylmenaquinone methyltransferase/2-methoxy-6-polyprenyl-1,4-benzoquinol methylase
MEWTVGWWQVSVQRVYPTNSELAKTYNQAAGWWHQHLQILGYGRAYRQLWRSLSKGGYLPHGTEHKNICDCGIGTAAFSLAFAQTLNPNVNIVGIDLSLEMLKIAQVKLAKGHIQHQLCQSDVRTLPFENSVFDAVISAHMLEHLPDPKEGIKEMFRVLRPGAPLILVVTRSGILGSLIQWHWGNRCFSPNELVTLMKEAGFSNLNVIPFTLGLARFTSSAYIGFRP